MNEAKRNQTQQYFQSAKAECQSQIAALQADHRADEAVFVKIRLNMFDIFHSVFSAGENVAGEDDGKLVDFFQARWAKISQDWKAALEKAEQHGNTEQAYIERIKLDAVMQISTEFYGIWEEQQ